MEGFYKLIRSQTAISEEELKYISSLTHPKEFAKNTVVLKQGEIERHLSFIEKGLAHYYFVGPNGKEISLLFTFENWFMGEVSSFITKAPSVCFIETLADTRVWRICYDDLQKIY